MNAKQSPAVSSAANQTSEENRIPLRLYLDGSLDIDRGIPGEDRISAPMRLNGRLVRQVTLSAGAKTHSYSCWEDGMLEVVAGQARVHFEGEHSIGLLLSEGQSLGLPANAVHEIEALSDLVAWIVLSSEGTD